MNDALTTSKGRITLVSTLPADADEHVLIWRNGSYKWSNESVRFATFPNEDAAMKIAGQLMPHTLGARIHVAWFA